MFVEISFTREVTFTIHLDAKMIKALHAKIIEVEDVKISRGDVPQAD
jgi:hypothetical protein